VAALLRGLHDKSPRVRALSAYALGDVPRPAPQVDAALRKALKDDDAMVRQSAEAALAR
jgi:HEAT repeat protein